MRVAARRHTRISWSADADWPCQWALISTGQYGPAESHRRRTQYSSVLCHHPTRPGPCSLFIYPVMSMEESISLEETNKIRISLGLKPLTDDKAPTDDKEKTAEDNYARQREREAKERETKCVALLERIITAC